MDSSSIFSSVKKLCGAAVHDDGFDQEIMDYINAEFLTLRQLHIGPEAGFSIQGPYETWSDFTPDKLMQNTVKEYIGLRVRMIFDPPASSTVAEQINNRISELEFRMNVQAEGDAAES